MIDSKIVFRKRNVIPLNVHSYKNFQKDFFHKSIKSLYFVKRNKQIGKIASAETERTD